MTCGIDFYANKYYLFARFACWCVVLFASAFDYYRHRGEKVYGWQLHFSIFLLICTITIKEGLNFAFLMSPTNRSFFCLVIIFFDRLVAASYITVLMLISYGWKITHDRLGDNAKAMLVAPVLFFVSGVVHEFVLQIETDGATIINPNQWSSLARNLILISSLVWIFTVVYMLMWIYQTVQLEKILLIEKIAKSVNRHRSNSETPSVTEDIGEDGIEMTTSDPAIVNPSESLSDVAATAVTISPVNWALKSDSMEGQVSDTGVAPLMMKHFDEIEEESSEEDDDNQHIPNTAKLVLLTRFFFAVSMYFLAMCLNRLVVIWNLGAVSVATYIFHDVVLLFFTASLAYIFRLREQNPYFMVSGYENVGAEENFLHEINVDTIADSDNDDDDDNNSGSRSDDMEL